MSTTPPTINQILAGKRVKAGPVRAALLFLAGLIERMQEGLRSSTIVWDAPVPPSMMSGFGVRDGIPRASGIYSQAQHSQALGMPFVRRTLTSNVNTPWSGWPAPFAGGFLVPSQDLDRVDHYIHDELNIGWRKSFYALASGDEPVHAIGDARGVIYVSCAGSKTVKKIDTRTGVITTLCSLSTLSAEYEHVQAQTGKLVINRHGTYLYLIAKRLDATDTNYRRVIQIQIANGSMTEFSMVDDEDIHDLAFVYGGASSTTDGNLFILQTAKLHRLVSGAEGIGVSGSPVYEVPTDAGTEVGAGTFVLCFAMVEYGGNIAILSRSVADLYIVNVISFDDDAGVHGLCYSSQTEVATSKVGGADPLAGSAGSDGRVIAWLESPGWIRYWSPDMSYLVAAGPLLRVGRVQFRAGISGTFTTRSGMIFTGTEWVYAANEGDLSSNLAVGLI